MTEKNIENINEEIKKRLEEIISKGKELEDIMSPLPIKSGCKYALNNNSTQEIAICRDNGVYVTYINKDGIKYKIDILRKIN